MWIATVEALGWDRKTGMPSTYTGLPVGTLLLLEKATNKVSLVSVLSWQGEANLVRFDLTFWWSS